jgi:sodium-dependent dicarboxylate transporter 2/3/5
MGMGEVRAIKASTFFAPFASDIIMLFLGGFLLSAAVVKHGVDTAAAAKMLGPFSRSPAMLVGGVLGVSAFFSMWMSNTACAAMMIAIVHPLTARAAPGSRLPAALVLAAAFGANIGGIGTPIGTPPNAIAFEALRRSGVGISFVQWMIFAIPLMVAMLAVAWGILVKMVPAAPGERLEPVRRSEAIGRRGWLTISIGLCAVALWLTGELHGISSGAVALLAAAALTAFGLLDRKDVDSIDWNVLILIWGGLAISDALKVSGLGEAIADLPVAQLGGGWVLGTIVAVLGVGLSTFMSNTAAAALLVPMALAFGVTGREQVAVVAALATSFAMALPVSTPPNAIAYATGKVSMAQMARVGGLISVLGVIAVSVGFRVVLPMVIGEPTAAP